MQRKLKIALIFFQLIIIGFAYPDDQWHPVLEEIYQFKGWEEHLLLGKGLINIGDIDNDGYQDYLSYSVESYSVFLFMGGFPPDTLPSLTFTEKSNHWDRKKFHDVTVGNVYGDSFPELVIPFPGYYDNSTYIYRLGPAQDTLADFIFDYGGSQVCSGDLNGDGYDDIILADPDSVYRMRGRIRIYLGGEELVNNPDYVIIGDSSMYRLGMNCTTGDLNGDGYDDLIVFGNNVNIISSFDYIRIYFGSAEFDTIYDIQMNDPSINPSSQGFTGRFVSFDYNQDGFDDLIASGLYVYNGSASFDTIPEYHFVWPGGGLNTYGGCYLFNAGDVNNDGYLDLGIGMPIMFGGKGLVHIKMGDKYGLDDGYIIIEPQSGDAFGYSGINISDVDGDHTSDIIIGEPGYFLTYKWGRLNYYSGNSSLKPDVKDTVVTIDNMSSLNRSGFELEQNYPNPFNASTQISYHVPVAGKAVIKIYDILGSLIIEYSNTISNSGKYIFNWDVLNNKGQLVSSGVYFYSLMYKTNNATYYSMKKMVYIK